MKPYEDLSPVPSLALLAIIGYAFLINVLGIWKFLELIGGAIHMVIGGGQ